MSVFYRYLRPKRFDERRAELVTISRGGICLRLERLPPGDVFFTYARCHQRDHFKKEVARLIADERAQVALAEPARLELLRHLPDSQNTDLLVRSIIRRCHLVSQSPGTAPVLHYIKNEFQVLATSLLELYLKNKAEERRLEAWKELHSELWRGTYGPPEDECLTGADPFSLKN